jgi:hypothetical protein
MIQLVWLYDIKNYGRRERNYPKWFGLVKGERILIKFELKLMRKALRILGIIFIISSLVLTYIFYGWKLYLIVSLAIFGNSLEKTFRE